MAMTDRESEEVKALFGAWMSASASYIFEHSGDFSGDFKALHADAMRRGHALHVDADGMFRRRGYDRYCLEDDAEDGEEEMVYVIDGMRYVAADLPGGVGRP